jgi:nitrogen regulatory protein P-II 1
MLPVKKIEAIIRPFKLEEVKHALCGLGVAGMTISEVSGFGQPIARKQPPRRDGYALDFLPKVKLEVVVRTALANRVVTEIVKYARTGKIGDGEIFISEVESALRIRTGERGESAV